MNTALYLLLALPSVPIFGAGVFFLVYGLTSGTGTYLLPGLGLIIVGGRLPSGKYANVNLGEYSGLQHLCAGPAEARAIISSQIRFLIESGI